MIYMLKLLCAIVPCHATMKPPEAHIANFPPNYLTSNNTTVPESIHILDPVLVQQNISNDNDLQRIKRQNETVRIRYSSTSPKPPSPSLFPGWNIFRDQQKTPQQYENLRNPFKTLMNAVSKGVEEGSGFTHNFGNRFVPFPESNRVSGAGGNAKRNVNDNGERKETLVYLRNGDVVEGYYMGTMKGHRLIAFEGIPYAESPVGNLRFRPPVPKRPWRGVLKATRPGSECLQRHPINMFRVSGSEDCLFLQIYTPQTSSSQNKGKPLPVLFFIHGGSFEYGSGHEYGPAYLKRDTILVTFNYRLGALGFLSTGDQAIPGNFGLKDQALALRWVYDNIEQFGGDKEQITLFGQSAGGISAHLHLLSNKTTHLFKRGISLSGSAFGFWPVVQRERALNFTSRLAKHIRCPQGNSEKLLTCLRGTRANFIIGAQLHFFNWIPFHPLIVFAPVVEPEGPDTFLTKSPEEIYNSGKVEKKPWIFGQTSQEGHFETYMINLFLQTPVMSARVKQFLPVVLDYQDFIQEAKRSEVSKKVIDFYGANNTDPKLMDVISDMYTDKIFTNGIQQSIRSHGSIAPTCAYIFSYKGQNYNLGEIFGVAKSDWGVVHTEDLFYMLNSSVLHHGLRRKDPEYKMSKIMTNLVTNFAKNGEPLYTDASGTATKIWDPAIETIPTEVRIPSNLTKTNRVSNIPINYLQLDTVIEMIKDPYAERNKFWKSLGIPI